MHITLKLALRRAFKKNVLLSRDFIKKNNADESLAKSIKTKNIYNQNNNKMY